MPIHQPCTCPPSLLLTPRWNQSPPCSEPPPPPATACLRGRAQMSHHPSGLPSGELAVVSHVDGFGPPELECPFGKIGSVDGDELRETAYELFFTACRSSPGFGGRTPITYYSSQETNGNIGGGGGGGEAGSPGGGGGGTKGGGTGMMVVTSRIKRALGLRTRRSATPTRPMNHSGNLGNIVSGGSGPNSPKARRPMTSAEIMRQQMRVTEQSDNRLRKTLMRTLVGQMGRRAETIILPLELLRQLKPSEFNDAQEYHTWQRRQLKILETGLVTHPSIPLDRLNSSALRLREIVLSSVLKPIDTSKNSEIMRTLCVCAITLAWRSPNGSPCEVCHWADGFPLNVHLYLSLLRSIFDLREETVVLDEIDELLELMKKTWTALGINRMIHNICFTWVLFEQYVMTGQVEPDLMCATLSMLVEVANDAKRSERELCYTKVLSGALNSMHSWAESKMTDYHELFDKATIGMMENVLCLALSTARIIAEDVSGSVVDRENVELLNASNGRVDNYIRSSLKNAFTKILESSNGRADNMVAVEEDPSEIVLQLAKETEDLALIERDTFSSMLKRWHPVPTAVAVVTLHNCFGVVLKQYLSRVSTLNDETVQILQAAGKLEKVLVQMVVEDSVDCEDGGKGIVREMVPFEVDSIITKLLKTWIDERLMLGRDCLNRAKEVESWNPKSKSEPYAQSAVDLMKLAKLTVDEFFEIPVGSRDELLQDLADGLDGLFQDYTSFVQSCGSKQNYIPALPPLTRCNQDSKLSKLWRKTAPCKAVTNCPKPKTVPAATDHPRLSTSRGTQRLYIRLNTLHYLLALLHSIDKSLSIFSTRGPSPSPRSAANVAVQAGRRRVAPTHFDLARSSIQSAINHVAEVTAYRLIFLDSAHSFYEGLYLNGVAGARIRPAIRSLKQNLTLLISALTDRAQPPAVREVMKASFEAFLMVLLAGGSGRTYARSDCEAVAEDFTRLKRLFCTSGEGLVAEEVVEREAEVVEGVVELMGLCTEKLVEDFTATACKASGLGLAGAGGAQHKVPMPPTTGRWHKSDPNTLLRVLCHRNDDAANRFLKRAFQLPKRR